MADKTVELVHTTEPLRLSYDASNYASFAVNSAGDFSISAGAILLNVPLGGKINIGQGLTKTTHDTIVNFGRQNPVGLFSSHTIEDNSALTATVDACSYATFDSKVQITAVDAHHYDHIAGFQARMEMRGSGILDFFYGFMSEPALLAGTTTSCIGFQARDPLSGGAITTQYGLKVENLTRATTNYAIYTGTGLVRLGGAVQAVSGLGVGGATDAARAVLIYSITLAGANQTGLGSQVTFTSSATSSGTAISATLITANNAFTMASGFGVWIGSASKGAASTITTVYGLFISDQTVGATNIALQTGLGSVIFGDKVTTSASTTARAGLNIPHGAAPTSPVNGDEWSTTAGRFCRINGVTKTYTLT